MKKLLSIILAFILLSSCAETPTEQGSNTQTDPTGIVSTAKTSGTEAATESTTSPSVSDTQKSETTKYVPEPPAENPVGVYSDDPELEFPYNLVWESAPSEPLDVVFDCGREEYYVELLGINVEPSPLGFKYSNIGATYRYGSLSGDYYVRSFAVNASRNGEAFGFILDTNVEAECSAKVMLLLMNTETLKQFTEQYDFENSEGECGIQGVIPTEGYEVLAFAVKIDFLDLEDLELGQWDPDKHGEVIWK